jgi:hypothetical protein
VIATFPNASNVKPRTINDNGVIIGTYTSPECSVGCSFVAVPTGGPSICSQTVGMTYANPTLTMNFTIATTAPTTWTTYLVVQNVAYRLWQLPLQVVQPSTPVSVPLTIGPNGTLLLASFLSTPAHGTMCADLFYQNTSQLPE